MKTHCRTLILGLVMALATCHAARADLVLVLDTATKNFWFDGSATGTPVYDPFSQAYEAWWYAGSGGTTESFDAVGSTYLSPSGNTFATPNSGFLRAFDGAGSRVALSLFFASGNSVSLSGLGVNSAGSYADWGVDQQGRLEAYIGSNLPLQTGSGFGNLAVTSGSIGIPEIDPAGMGSVLALVTGALGLLERRGRKPA